MKVLNSLTSTQLTTEVTVMRELYVYNMHKKTRSAWCPGNASLVTYIFKEVTFAFNEALLEQHCAEEAEISLLMVLGTWSITKEINHIYS